MGTETFEELETALLPWFWMARNNTISIYGHILLIKGRTICRMSEFKVSTWWIDIHTERHDLSLRYVSGKSRSVKTDSHAMPSGHHTLRLSDVNIQTYIHLQSF